MQNNSGEAYQNIDQYQTFNFDNNEEEEKQFSTIKRGNDDEL